MPSSDYPVLFDLRIAARRDGSLAGSIVNGSVETPLSSVTWDGSTLLLEIDSST